MLYLDFYELSSLKERKEKLALKSLVYAKQHDLIGVRDLKSVLHTLQKPLTEAQETYLIN